MRARSYYIRATNVELDLGFRVLGFYDLYSSLPQFLNVNIEMIFLSSFWLGNSVDLKTFSTDYQRKRKIKEQFEERRTN